jgi:hypothetical protein
MFKDDILMHKYATEEHESESKSTKILSQEFWIEDKFTEYFNWM